MLNSAKHNQGSWTLIGLLLLGAAWLVPNHIVPWVSFWNEAVAFAGAWSLALSQLWRLLPGQRILLQPAAVFLLCVLLLSLALQVLQQSFIFYADITIVTVYIAAFFLLFTATQNSADVYLDTSLAWVFLIFALAAVFIGMLQWQSMDALAPFVADLPPGSSIISNVAQRNHFSSICFIGICMLLYLYTQRKLRQMAFVLCLFVLLLGIAMAQSRTALLQAAALLLIGCIKDKRSAKLYVAVAFGIFLAFFAIKPINEFLLLGIGRDLSQISRNSDRQEIWQTMLLAANQQLWLGYGWLRAAAAHLGVAGQVPHTTGFGIIEYSHNLVLDLWVWLGAPLALAVLAGIAALFVQAWRACGTHGRSPFLLAAVGILIHSMLEYSYAYSYFLLPLAIFLALSIAPPKAGTWQLPKKAALVLTALCAAVASIMLVDYARIETSFVDARFTRTEFGKHLPTVPTEKLWLLDNVEAYHRAIAFKDWPKVGAADVENYRKVYERYGYPAAIYDFAMASHIADPRFDPNPAFTQLCAIYSASICVTYQRKWQADNEKYFGADKANARGIALRPITVRPISAQTPEVCEPPYCE